VYVRSEEVLKNYPKRNPFRKKEAEKRLHRFGMEFLSISRGKCRLRCHCGSEFFKSRKDVMQVNWGSFKSCGCSRHGKNSRQWKGAGEMSGTYWNILKTNARRRDLPVKISKEYLWNRFKEQQGRCAISGVKLSLSDYSSVEKTASIDRINSSKGYEIGNVQWVHKIINKMKWDLSDSEFILWCKVVAENKV
jgi:hypothetical protein